MGQDWGLLPLLLLPLLLTLMMLLLFLLLFILPVVPTTRRSDGTMEMGCIILKIVDVGADVCYLRVVMMLLKGIQEVFYPYSVQKFALLQILRWVR